MNQNEWKIVISLDRTPTGLKVVINTPGDKEYENSKKVWKIEDTDKPLWAAAV